MTKAYLRTDAIKFRKAGYSYSYIQKQTGVSKSTLSEWLSDIPYKPNKETADKIVRARLMANEAQRAKKRKSIEDAEKLATKDIGKFTKRDLFMLGIGIYIGEGAKTSHIVRVVNSDPKIIKTTISWFKKCFHLQNSNFSIRIHLYPDTNQGKAISFWSKETGLSKDSFLNCVVDTRTNKKKKNHGKLPFGTAHISIKGAGNNFFFRRIMSLIDKVHQNAGVV
ncbi:MAG: helix-turn-helix transcriptional regulator [Candidatus Paceibacterota bacterium]